MKENNNQLDAILVSHEAGKALNTPSEEFCIKETAKEKQEDDQFQYDLVLSADNSSKNRLKRNDANRGPMMMGLGAFSEQPSPKGFDVRLLQNLKELDIVDSMARGLSPMYGTLNSIIEFTILEQNPESSLPETFFCFWADFTSSSEIISSFHNFLKNERPLKKKVKKLINYSNLVGLSSSSSELVEDSESFNTKVLEMKVLPQVTRLSLLIKFVDRWTKFLQNFLGFDPELYLSRKGNYPLQSIEDDKKSLISDLFEMLSQIEKTRKCGSHSEFVTAKFSLKIMSSAFCVSEDIDDLINLASKLSFFSLNASLNTPDSSDSSAGMSSFSPGLGLSVSSERSSLPLKRRKHLPFKLIPNFASFPGLPSKSSLASQSPPEELQQTRSSSFRAESVPDASSLKEEQKQRGLRTPRWQHKLRKRRFGDLSLVGSYRLEQQIAELFTVYTLLEYRKIRLMDIYNEQKRNKSIHIKNLISLFNRISWWTISYVLRGHYCLVPAKSKKSKNKLQATGFSEEVNIPSSSFDEDVNDRTLRLVLVLNIAESLRNLRNFHLFFAVMGGLNQPHLDWIWAFVKEKQKLRFQNLNRAVKPDNNYMVYQADLSKAGNKAHIPYFGFTTRTLFPFESQIPPFKHICSKKLIDFHRCSSRFTAIDEFLHGQHFAFAFESGYNDLKVLQDNKFLKLHKIFEFHLKAVDDAGEENLLELSKSEKQRATSRLVTGLKNGGFM